MSLFNEPLLLMPMHVDALAVGTSLPDKSMFQWTNLAPNFSKLKDYQFGSALIGDDSASGNPFDEAEGLKTGIHLHFRLPRAFAHGSQEGAGDLLFPAIPNRWLVQRFGGEPASYKAWLVKSDAPAPDDAPGIPWPTFPKDEQIPVEFKRIGTCTELTGPVAEGDEAALVNLTAVGQGNPIFSAYYPACHSVLGFYDAMTDVDVSSQGSRLSYLVTGWFSAASDDPLQTAAWRTGLIPKDAEASFRAKNKIPVSDPLSAEQRAQLLWNAWFAERQQWTCNFEKNLEPPSRLLCHGVVRGIIWHGPDYNYMQPSGAGASVSGPEVFSPNTDNHKKAYKVAVGNTGGEALAALLARGEVDQDLLAALQADLLDQPVTAEVLQYELHSRRFDGVQGGTTFSIQLQADQSEITGADKSALASGRQSPIIPRPLRDLLEELNQKQSRCDEFSRRFEDCRWQVYALWYLWTSELKKGEDSDRIKRFAAQLAAFKEILNNAKTDLDGARNNPDDGLYAVRKKIIDELAKYPKTQPDGSPRLNAQGQPELKYRLLAAAALPFFRPSEPVIAVSGPAMARVNSPEPSGTLACRLLGQVVTGFTLQPQGGATLDVKGESLLHSLFPQGTPHGLDAIHKSLLGEAPLLDEQQAATIAGQASQQDLERLTGIVKALQNPTSTEAQAKPAPAPNALIGSLPVPIASFPWQRNPWTPLLLVWKVSWRSEYQSVAGQTLQGNLVASRWSLHRRSGDLVADEATSTDQANYQGYSILTPSASRNLAKRLKELNEAHPLISTLENQRAQLQRLHGFNDALMLQQTGIQIPPLDYGKWSDPTNTKNDFFLDPIAGFLNQGVAPAKTRNTFRTVSDTLDRSFLPIRVGQLKIEQLSIVDAFGQTLKLAVAEINASVGKSDAMLWPAHSCEVSSAPTAITLRPRFAQPARLRFQWASGSADPKKDGPVCGWILPNHLEKSFTIYAADGKPLGALQKKLGQVSGTSDKFAFYWVEVPGAQNGGIPQGDDVGRRLAEIIDNAHLRHFCSWALGLSPDMGGVFSTLVSEALASADQRVPDEDPGVSVLVGRPLALVRASLQFEMSGLPAHRPELRADTGNNIADLLETNGFEKVQWPLRLGDIAARNDGLIGLFRCSAANGGGLITSGAFYPAWGQDSGDYAKGPEAKERDFAVQDFLFDCVQPLEVTMLMDPQARVHATTGALPRAFIELPPEAATGAKRARAVFFQTAPVLGFSPTPAMPRPSDDYGEWSWAYRPDVTQWKLDPNLVEAAERGGFADAWPTIAEGWLKLEIAPIKLSFWIREPVEQVAPGTSIHLAWSLQGAESLELVQVDKVVKDGQSAEIIKSIKKWNAPQFESEYTATVNAETTNAETTYRIIASVEDAQVFRELTVKIAKNLETRT